MTEALSEGLDPNVAIGERVHLLMRRKRITQTAMAKALHIDQSGLSRKLLGLRPWFPGELVGVADVLDVHPAELLGGRAPDGWESRACRDSNPKPSVLEPRHLRLIQGGQSVKRGLTPLGVVAISRPRHRSSLGPTLSERLAAVR